VFFFTDINAMNMQNLAALAAIASNGNGGLSSLTGSGKKKRQTQLSFYPPHTLTMYTSGYE
jgi:hypothetical protein